MALVRSEISCDSCGVPNDGDVISTLDFETNYGNIKPAHAKELKYFWLCGECKQDYPRGPRSFFVDDFFDTEPYCAECEVEDVENWGHLCDYCMGEDDD